MKPYTTIVLAITCGLGSLMLREAVADNAPAQSIWEPIDKPFMNSTYLPVVRASTPDGWIVVITKPGQAVTAVYVPDAAHIWSGR